MDQQVRALRPVRLGTEAPFSIPREFCHRFNIWFWNWLNRLFKARSPTD